MGQAMSRPNEEPLPKPLAYFFTWHTYGTWLPGDERGWVKYRRGHQPPAELKKLDAIARMREDAFLLDLEQRHLVEATIADHCRLRGLTLHAVNCRSNHVHVVLSGDDPPDVVRSQLKAWCTRKLKDLESSRATTNADGTRITGRKSWWGERGSRRYINDEDARRGGDSIRPPRTGPPTLARSASEDVSRMTPSLARRACVVTASCRPRHLPTEPLARRLGRS